MQIAQQDIGQLTYVGSAFPDYRRPEHGLVEITGSVLVGHHEKWVSTKPTSGAGKSSSLI